MLTGLHHFSIWRALLLGDLLLSWIINFLVERIILLIRKNWPREGRKKPGD